jgi:sulfate adenylyltransferase subunit 2
MNKINKLEQESIYIIREAYRKLKPLGVLWSMGKDSNVVLWLIKKAFLGDVPFKVLLLDTGDELDEVYQFRDRYVKEWDLDYVNIECPGIEETDITLPMNARMAARKTLGLKKALKEHDFKGIAVGIRRDEQPIRGKERVFSPRNDHGVWDYKDQPPEFWSLYQTETPADVHVRVHPLLSWSEVDIWAYIKQENIPVVPLYFARDGLRYRSLGEKSITNPIKSSASNIDEIIREISISQVSERSGRTMDTETEDAFERLRVDGYM